MERWTFVCALLKSFSFQLAILDCVATPSTDASSPSSPSTEHSSPRRTTSRPTSRLTARRPWPLLLSWTTAAAAPVPARPGAHLRRGLRRHAQEPRARRLRRARQGQDDRHVHLRRRVRETESCRARAASEAIGCPLVKVGAGRRAHTSVARDRGESSQGWVVELCKLRTSVSMVRMRFLSRR